MCHKLSFVLNCCDTLYSTRTRPCHLAEANPNPNAKVECEKTNTCRYIMVRCHECKEIARLEEELERLHELQAMEAEVRRLEREIGEEEEALRLFGGLRVGQEGEGK